MKKTLLVISLFTAFNVSAFTSTDATESNAIAQAKASVFPVIDSSNWKVTPEDYGMTVEEYFLAESHAFMNEFAINRELVVNNFFHFTELAKAEDKWVVSLHIQDENHASTKYNSDRSFDVVFGSMECKTIADTARSNFAYTPDDNWGFLMRAYLPKVDEMKQYKMPEITR